METTAESGTEGVAKSILLRMPSNGSFASVLSTTGHHVAAPPAFEIDPLTGKERLIHVRQDHADGALFYDPTLSIVQNKRIEHLIRKRIEQVRADLVAEFRIKKKKMDEMAIMDVNYQTIRLQTMFRSQLRKRLNVKEIRDSVVNSRADAVEKQSNQYGSSASMTFIESDLELESLGPSSARSLPPDFPNATAIPESLVHDQEVKVTNSPRLGPKGETINDVVSRRIQAVKKRGHDAGGRGSVQSNGSVRQTPIGKAESRRSERPVSIPSTPTKHVSQTPLSMAKVSIVKESQSESDDSWDDMETTVTESPKHREQSPQKLVPTKDLRAAYLESVHAKNLERLIKSLDAASPRKAQGTASQSTFKFDLDNDDDTKLEQPVPEELYNQIVKDNPILSSIPIKAQDLQANHPTSQSSNAHTSSTLQPGGTMSKSASSRSVNIVPSDLLGPPTASSQKHMQVQQNDIAKPPPRRRYLNRLKKDTDILDEYKAAKGLSELTPFEKSNTIEGKQIFKDQFVGDNLELRVIAGKLTSHEFSNVADFRSHSPYAIDEETERVILHKPTAQENTKAGYPLLTDLLESILDSDLRHYFKPDGAQYALPPAPGLGSKNRQVRVGDLVRGLLNRTRNLNPPATGNSRREGTAKASLQAAKKHELSKSQSQDSFGDEDFEDDEDEDFDLNYNELFGREEGKLSHQAQNVQSTLTVPHGIKKSTSRNSIKGSIGSRSPSRNQLGGGGGDGRVSAMSARDRSRSFDSLQRDASGEFSSQDKEPRTIRPQVPAGIMLEVEEAPSDEEDNSDMAGAWKATHRGNNHNKERHDDIKPPAASQPTSRTRGQIPVPEVNQAPQRSSHQMGSDSIKPKQQSTTAQDNTSYGKEHMASRKPESYGHISEAVPNNSVSAKTDHKKGPPLHPYADRRSDSLQVPSFEDILKENIGKPKSITKKKRKSIKKKPIKQNEAVPQTYEETTSSASTTINQGGPNFLRHHGLLSTLDKALAKLECGYFHKDSILRKYKEMYNQLELVSKAVSAWVECEDLIRRRENMLLMIKNTEKYSSDPRKQQHLRMGDQMDHEQRDNYIKLQSLTHDLVMIMNYLRDDFGDRVVYKNELYEDKMRLDCQELVAKPSKKKSERGRFTAQVSQIRWEISYAEVKKMVEHPETETELSIALTKLSQSLGGVFRSIPSDRPKQKAANPVNIIPNPTKVNFNSLRFRTIRKGHIYSEQVKAPEDEQTISTHLQAGNFMQIDSLRKQIPLTQESATTETRFPSIMPRSQQHSSQLEFRPIVTSLNHTDSTPSTAPLAPQNADATRSSMTFFDSDALDPKNQKSFLQFPPVKGANPIRKTQPKPLMENTRQSLTSGSQKHQANYETSRANITSRDTDRSVESSLSGPIRSLSAALPPSRKGKGDRPGIIEDGEFSIPQQNR